MESNNGKALPCIDMQDQAMYQEPNPTGSPERNLLMAILERAILDFVGNETREAQRAEEWLFDEELNPNSKNNFKYDQFSFSWVCHQLDLDPYNIANIIKAMPKRGKNRIAPWYFAGARA